MTTENVTQTLEAPCTDLERDLDKARRALLGRADRELMGSERG